MLSILMVITIPVP